MALLRRIRSFFSLLHDYRDPFERVVARDLLRFVITLGVIIAVGLIVPIALGIIPITGTLAAIIIVSYISLFLVGFLVQFGRVYAARNLLLLLAIATSLSIVFQPQQFELATAVNLVIPIVAAGLLASRGVVIGTVVFVAAIFVYLILTQPVVTIVITPENRPSVLLAVLLNVLLLGQFAIVFGAEQRRVAQAFSRDIRSLRRALDTAELDSLQLDETQLIATSLRNLKPGFDRVQIYLVDPNTRAVATPYYEAFGQEAVQTGQPLDLSTISAVNEVLRTGQVLVITPDSGDLRQRHLGPGMQMAVLVPLVADDQVLGVIDFQLSVVTEFSDAQMAVFSTYGKRLGFALARARLVNQLYADVQLQQSVIAGLRRRVEALERNVRSEADASTWQTYFQEVANGALGYDVGAGATVLALDQLPPESYSQLSTGQMLMQPHDDGTLVTVPIRLRETLLGALSFRLTAGKALSQRQQELIQNVVDRLALALENRRLLQQSQAQAQREAKAGEVASLLFSTTDIRELLNTAAEQFNEVLGAVNTSVRVLSLEANEPS